MKMLLLLIVSIISLSMTTGYAQNEIKAISKYQSQTGTLNDEVKFQYKETVLDAKDIENNARLIHLRFDKEKGIIRLDDTKLIEDDAPATGVPEGYDSYFPEPVEWVEDLQKGIVLKKY